MPAGFPGGHFLHVCQALSVAGFIESIGEVICTMVGIYFKMCIFGLTMSVMH